MKKFILILSAITVCAVFTACENTNDTEETTTTTVYAETTVSEITTAANETTSATLETKTTNNIPKETHIPVSINVSPDKYTWYIKDYVGKNCATIGYTGISGNRYDHYGDTTITLNLIADDGNYVNADDEEALKKYYVTGQSIEPNTEVKLTFKEEEEWDYAYVDYQNIEEIDLYVTRIENAE